MSIMNEVDWKKDGEVGCLMTLVKVVSITAVAVTVAVVGFVAIANLW